jgi:hypothetical protein
MRHVAVEGWCEVSENKTAADALSRMGDSIHFERWGHPQCDVRQSLPQAGAIGYSTEDAIALRDWLIRQFPLPPAPLPPEVAGLVRLARSRSTRDNNARTIELVCRLAALPLPDDRANTEGE